MQAALMPALLSSVEAKARVGHDEVAAAAAASTYYVRPMARIVGVQRPGATASRPFRAGAETQIEGTLAACNTLAIT